MLGLPYIYIYANFFFLRKSGNLIQNSKTSDIHKEGETSSLPTIPQILGGIVFHLIVSMTWVLAPTASSCAALFVSLNFHLTKKH
jgi:hypothetical protein